MWQLYDSLISAVDESVLLKDFVVGPMWTVVLSEDDVIGIAPTISEKFPRFDFSVEPRAGMPLSQLVPCIKSWNYHESALGLAALNAFYNRNQTLPENAQILPGGRRSKAGFMKFCEEHNKNHHTVMIEPHYYREEISAFPGIVDIIRKDTTFRDYIYPAYQELLLEADQVIFSGIPFVDKMVSPILQSAKNNQCEIFLWGPDIPLSPIFKDLGISEICGFVVDDVEKCFNYAKFNMRRDEFLRFGHFVII